jgi:hypothetical protein
VDTISVVWDDTAIKLSATSQGGAVAQGMALLAGELVNEMKRRCPVAPHDRPATRRWPARRSGTLRTSITRFKQPDGSYLVGPTDRTASGDFLGTMIERGTGPHPIDALGPWSLRNAVTGQSFGPHVNHPGTPAHPFIAPAAEALNGRRIVIR